MKRFQKGLSLLFFLLAIGWYAFPPVHRILCLPSAVHGEMSLVAPTLSAETRDAVFVRETGDQRLNEVQNGTVTVKLFGILPVRTLKKAVDGVRVLSGGEAIGVVLHTGGVQIVGLGEIKTEDGTYRPAQTAGIETGDTILAVNGVDVLDAAHFSTLCDAEMLTLTCCRDGEIFHTQIWPQKEEDGVRRIGAWVRDSTSGIGTLTYVDKANGRFAALGHGVTDVDTEELLYTASGFLTEAEIYGVRIGGYGEAGELLGSFSTDVKDAVATVTRNTECGICGTMNAYSNQREELLTGSRDAVYRGTATILSTIDGHTVESFSVEIIRTDVQAGKHSNGMMLRVTDERLLSRTGGIVQGMSGSPIIQDGKLIGAVTHVLVNDSTRGYGIFIENMLEAAG